FWRWIYNSKHQIDKKLGAYYGINEKILYALSNSEINTHYNEFRQRFYNYSQLKKYFEHFWKCQQSWALLFHTDIPLYGKNTNNYIEHSFRSFENYERYHFCKDTSLQPFLIKSLLGYSAQNRSFYTTLYTKPILQNQEVLCINDKMRISNTLSKTKKPEKLNKENKEIEEIDSSDFNSFLEEVRLDYQFADQPL
ncbi:23864_t:CDS:2, partial [Gigaspora margarita]